MKGRQLRGAFPICCYTILAAAIVCVSIAAIPRTAFAAQFTCNPADVAVFPGKRIHVQCSPGDGAIRWFALRVSNQAEANRMLTILSTAFALQKKLTIWYNQNDTSGANVGCNPSDCRLIQGARMY